MTETVLLLGGAQCNRRTIEAARANYRVIVSDANEDAPGFAWADVSAHVDLTDVEGTVSLAEEQGVDAVVPLNDFGVLTAADVTDKLGLPGMAREVAERCVDKALMRRTWEETGLPQPDFGVATTLEEGRALIPEIGFPLVCKPAKSRGGSRGVSLVENRSSFGKAFEFAASAFDDDSRVLIESCVQGSEHSIDVLVHEGKAHPIVISDKEKTLPPYRVDRSVIYPTDREERDEIGSVASRAVEAIGIERGPAHVEVGMTDVGPILFELGGRAGGCATPDPIIPAATGIDYVDEMLRTYLGGSPSTVTPKKCDGVTYRFLMPSPGKVVSISGVEEARQMEGVLEVQLWVTVGDEVPMVAVGGDRSGSIVTRGETRAEAIDRADRAETQIDINTEGKGCGR